MTEAEACALADKRQAHKSKHLDADWRAVHDPARGWIVKLVKREPPAPALPTIDRLLACVAVFGAPATLAALNNIMTGNQPPR